MESLLDNKFIKMAKEHNEKKWWKFYAFALLIFFEPGAFNEPYFVNNVDKIYDVLKLIISFFIICNYLYFKIKEKNFSKNKYIILLIIYQAFCFLSTLINSADIIRFAGPALTSVIIFMIVEILTYYKKLFDVTHIVKWYFRGCFLINLLSIIQINILKNQLPCYFLGIDNRFVFTYLPWIFFEIIDDIHFNGKITKSSWISFILAEASMLMTNTMAAMLTFLLFVIPLTKRNKTIKKYDWIMYFVLLYINELIVRLKITFLYSNFFDKIGKYPHLSGRTMIWDACYRYSIKQHPIIGVGMRSESNDREFLRTHVNDVYAVNHEHNTIVDITYRYGYVGLTLFAIFLIFPLINLHKNNKSQYTLPIMITILIAMILSIFDTFLFAGVYFVLACASNIELMELNNECNNELGKYK